MLIIFTIINTIAIIVIPIYVSYRSRTLQLQDKIREEKKTVFKTLMAYRGSGWTYESVAAFNVLEIVFSDEKEVCAAWVNYKEKLCVDKIDDAAVCLIQASYYKLLETMAKSLGYSNINWQTIQQPYIPFGMQQRNINQQMFEQEQLLAIKKLNELLGVNNTSG